MTAGIEYAALLEERAEDLYEHAPAGFVSALPDGTLVKVNETLLAWTGYRRDELVGRRRLHDLLAPGARIYYETHYSPLLLMQGSVREIAAEIVCADGRRLPVLMNSTLHRDDAGTARIVRTTVFDASDRRRYERELLRARADAEARARAALALAHVDEGVLLVGAGGRVDVVNPAAETILALAAGTAVGRPVSELVPDWELLVADVPVREPGGDAAPVTIPLERGGEERWVEVAGVDSGDGVVYTIRDVSADHRLDQLRNDLIAIVSHELRTPLTGAYGAARTLVARYDDLDDEPRRALLEMIVEQSERLAKIVDQILFTSRLDHGNVRIDVDSFDAAEVVADLVQNLDRGRQERVVVDVDPDVRVRGDGEQVRQVLTNLLDNALKYSDGAVHVAVAAGDSVARFTVADEGPGIPAAERDRIFEKFYRLDPDQHGGVSGTGLGLYIANELVKRMSGRVGLLPRERGSAFFVELPLAD